MANSGLIIHSNNKINLSPLIGMETDTYVQIFGYNSQLYNNFSDALNRAQGIGGVSILLQLGDLSNPELRMLTDQLERIRYGGDEAFVKRLSIRGLLPDTDHYMTYDGSTTAPACHETVTWVVLNKPIYITKQQPLKTICAAAAVLSDAAAAGVSTEVVLSSLFALPPCPRTHGRGVRLSKTTSARPSALTVLSTSPLHPNTESKSRLEASIGFFPTGDFLWTSSRAPIGVSSFKINTSGASANTARRHRRQSTTPQSRAQTGNANAVFLITSNIEKALLGALSCLLVTLFPHSVDQLYALRRLMQGSPDHPKAPLGNNYRPPQALLHRPIRTNIDFKTPKINGKAACPTMYREVYYKDFCSNATACEWFAGIQNLDIKNVTSHDIGKESNTDD
uniref:Alpha-carbonic anhydrase domain-containing protein n=1 Tax=Glossina brevipalpis TaxID=37001 RepID=A0A1A9WS65_9MUSC